MPAIDGAGPKPPYQQIADDLRRRIREGELQAGERIPSSRELMNDYGVASMTVHQAIKLLRDEHAVVSFPGRGVYVTESLDEDLPRPENDTTIGDLQAELAELKERISGTEHADDVASLREELSALKQQVGTIEAHLIDLYAKVGQSYPHDRRSNRSADGSQTRRRASSA
jgi:GntR family transcriptional regulator